MFWWVKREIISKALSTITIKANRKFLQIQPHKRPMFGMHHITEGFWTLNDFAASFYTYVGYSGDRAMLQRVQSTKGTVNKK